MYLAIVTHDTGHGESSNVLAVSENFVSLIKAVMSVEEMGYEFYGDETGVIVYQAYPDVVYPKRVFKTNGSSFPEDSPLVFARTHTDGGWRQEWFKKDFLARFNGATRQRIKTALAKDGPYALVKN